MHNTVFLGRMVTNMLSFDITDRNIRIVRGKESGGKVKILTAVSIDIDEGLIVNGLVQNIPKIASVINIAANLKKSKDKEVVISISSGRIIYKELHIPKAGSTQLLSMIQNHIQYNMGVSENYSISYTIMGEFEEEGGTILKVFAVACPFEIVDGFRKLFNMLGMSLRSVMVSCNAVTRIIISDVKIRMLMPLLLVQIDPNFIVISIYENNNLVFSRYASISPDDYEDAGDYIYDAVNENIYRMLQFQKSRSGGEQIQNVVFYGDTSEYVRFTNALTRMEIKTSLISVPNCVSGYENFEFQAYANAVGAMFRRKKDIERINLIEADSTIGRANAGTVFMFNLSAAAIACAAIVFAAVLYLNVSINNYNNDISAIQAEINSPDKVAKLVAVEQLETKIASLNKYIESLKLADENFKSKKVFTTKVLNDIEKNLSKNNTYFNNLAFGEGRIEIKCIAKNNNAPSNVVASFYEQDIFDNITYTGFSETDEGYEFTVIIYMRENPPVETAVEDIEDSAS